MPLKTEDVGWGKRHVKHAVVVLVRDMDDRGGRHCHKRNGGEGRAQARVRRRGVARGTADAATTSAASTTRRARGWTRWGKTAAGTVRAGKTAGSGPYWRRHAPRGGALCADGVCGVRRLPERRRSPPAARAWHKGDRLFDDGRRGAAVLPHLGDGQAAGADGLFGVDQDRYVA